MINFTTGDLFEIEADIKVNTVNCVGVMGKGIALQFKKRYPKMFEEYRRACYSNRVRIGYLHIWTSPDGTIIVNFPTKEHWIRKSEYSYIELGLESLRKFLTDKGKSRVLIPALGCSNGGLDWEIVSQMIEEKLDGLEAEIFVFEPQNR